MGKYETMSPTAALMAHNLLLFLAVQLGWTLWAADVSAAFLQGKELPTDRNIFLNIPASWPKEVKEVLFQALGVDGKRFSMDYVKAVKGVFGLPEAPRMWYLEYRDILVNEQGFVEMKLFPGLFVLRHPGGALRALATIHVDDTLMAGDASAEAIWKKLQGRVNFGQWRALGEGVKFCGRYLKQKDNFEVEVQMDDYGANVPLAVIAKGRSEDEPLTPEGVKQMASINGQLNWLARNLRVELGFGVSRAQQASAGGTVKDMLELNQVVRKARQPRTWTIRRLGCDIPDLVVLVATDGAFNNMPRQGSQQGMVLCLAEPEITEQPAGAVVITAASVRCKRVVRSSLAVEAGACAQGMECGDYLRAAMAEIFEPKFSVREWRRYAALWKQYSVIDAKTCFDSLTHESLPSDKRTALDIAAIKESLVDSGDSAMIRWVPGPQQIADAMTKTGGGNGKLEELLRTGQWCLKEEAEVAAKGAETREKRKAAGRLTSQAG